MIFKQLPDSTGGTPKATEVQRTIGAVASPSQDVVNMGRCASDERVEGYKTCVGTLLNFILPAAVSRPFRQVVLGGTRPSQCALKSPIKMSG